VPFSACKKGLLASQKQGFQNAEKAFLQCADHQADAQQGRRSVMKKGMKIRMGNIFTQHFRPKGLKEASQTNRKRAMPGKRLPCREKATR